MHRISELKILSLNKIPETDIKPRLVSLLLIKSCSSAVGLLQLSC